MITTYASVQLPARSNSNVATHIVDTEAVAVCMYVWYVAMTDSAVHDHENEMSSLSTLQN